MILDEPNLNLDTDAQESLNVILLEEKAKGTTVVLISHQESMINIADKVAVISKGGLEYYGTRDQILKKLQAIKSGTAAKRVVRVKKASPPKERGPK